MKVRRLAGIGMFLGALAAVVWAMVRFSGRPAPAMPEGHLHGAPGVDTARPVSLTAEEQRRIGVTFAAVEAGPISRTVRIVGLVGVDETRVRSVTSRVEAFVERLYADFTGRAVSAGEPLLDFYAPMVVAAQQELLLARDLERALGTTDAESRAAAARTVEAARQRLRLWDVPEAVIAAAEASGRVERRFALRSPWPGYILEKNVIEGQRVMAGDPLFRLADLRVVWVEGEVFEQDLPMVRAGLPVLATFQAFPGLERRGRVTYVYPTLDATTRTAKVRVELENRDLSLKPGMYALLQFDGVAGDGLSVPRSAVLSTGTRHLVFVRHGTGPLEPREIVVGVSTPDRIQVLRGLVVGDTVVASATFLVDAESNLGSLLGGMGGMPGMDMGPARRRDSAAVPPSTHQGH